ncbi:MAG TPA: hypothetical protein VF509_00155 [Sphingobium sp.]
MPGDPLALGSTGQVELPTTVTAIEPERDAGRLERQHGLFL